MARKRNIANGAGKLNRMVPATSATLMYKKCTCKTVCGVICGCVKIGLHCTVDCLENNGSTCTNMLPIVQTNEVDDDGDNVN